MRWKAKKEPQPGGERVLRKFLLFPRCIKGEWRWLEWAGIHQRMLMTTGYLEGVGPVPMLRWVNLAWADDSVVVTTVN